MIRLGEGDALSEGPHVFPIRDLTPTRITPYATVLLIAINVIVFFVWQPHANLEAELEFLYGRTAVACEIASGRPVTYAEIAAGVCETAAAGTRSAPAETPFPEKPLAMSVLISMFLHGGVVHLLGNMWFLWLFGNNVEEAFGHIRYGVGYILAGVVATFGFVWLHPDSTQPLVGASGAIAGVLGAYAVLFPTRLVLSFAFFTVLPIPAIVFLGLWFIGQFAVVDMGVAWESHVAGFVTGAVVATWFRRPLLDRVRAAQRGYR